MDAICLTDIFGYDGVVARARSRRKFQAQMRCVYLVDLYTLDFRKLLHAALHLHGFGGLISESLDKCLCVGNLFLLVKVGAGLLFDALFAQLYEFRVVYRIVIDFAA